MRPTWSRGPSWLIQNVPMPSGVASFKKPKMVHFIRSEEMPRTGSGKVIHRLIRDRFAQDATASIVALEVPGA